MWSDGGLGSPSVRGGRAHAPWPGCRSAGRGAWLAASRGTGSIPFLLRTQAPLPPTWFFWGGGRLVSCPADPRSSRPLVPSLFTARPARGLAGATPPRTPRAFLVPLPTLTPFTQLPSPEDSSCPTAAVISGPPCTSSGHSGQQHPERGRCTGSRWGRRPRVGLGAARRAGSLGAARAGSALSACSFLLPQVHAARGLGRLWEGRQFCDVEFVLGEVSAPHPRAHGWLAPGPALLQAPASPQKEESWGPSCRHVAQPLAPQEDRPGR